MMSNEMLSQDEIDALLKGNDYSQSSSKEDSYEINPSLSTIEIDALGEIGNISFGSSATALSALLNQKVDITTPVVQVIEKSKLIHEFPEPYIAIQVHFTKGFTGSNLLVFQQGDASAIADIMLGGDGTNLPDSLGEIQISAVQEAMNQMMGSAATSMSTIFNKIVDISPPSIDVLNVKEGEGTNRIPEDELLVKTSFRLKIGEIIDSKIMQLLPIHFAKSMVEELLNPQETASEEKSSSSNLSENHLEQNLSSKQSFDSIGHHEERNQYESMQSTYSKDQKNVSSSQHFGNSFTGGEQPKVQPAVFTDFEPYTLPEAEVKNLNVLMDIPLEITVELGRTKRSVKEILELSAGSIIELDNLAGEPVNILINGRLIAKGEVVVIDENFGVRVTDILSQSDRIKKLR
ncbi:flagellar motor switch phosphatase FliY [Bacillus sp. 03113]|uniref:flagellar motor switch phosphatase FliY n=1 Tax=Bacillus sp. 03113 TaxID=2578211 RepID=UPI0011423ED5|nr:flagellar motor switch phosphatase FliY [Bacillus sp. 03113]